MDNFEEGLTNQETILREIGAEGRRNPEPDNLSRSYQNS
jgi:hypothetical protein